MLEHLYLIDSEGSSTKSHAEFRKERETRDQIANIHRIIEKARESEKHLPLFH